jgi:hypothetical protein
MRKTLVPRLLNKRQSRWLRQPLLAHRFVRNSAAPSPYRTYDSVRCSLLSRAALKYEAFYKPIYRLVNGFWLVVLGQSGSRRLAGPLTNHHLPFTQYKVLGIGCVQVSDSRFINMGAFAQAAAYRSGLGIKALVYASSVHLLYPAVTHSLRTAITEVVESFYTLPTALTKTTTKYI